MTSKSVQLRTGSKVAIIGGGPAGSFFAMYLRLYAAERSIQPEITIYQQVTHELGRKGCKGCAGILSISLLRNLKELGLTIPEEIIQNRIESYNVHSPYASIGISNPEKDVQIISIYRGAGPRLSHYEHSISFDGWLLREAQKRSIKVRIETVSGIILEDGVCVEVAKKKLKYDFVALAAGVKSKPIAIQGLDYVPSMTHLMAQY